jgi:hypothetical protein
MRLQLMPDHCRFDFAARGLRSPWLDGTRPAWADGDRA